MNDANPIRILVLAANPSDKDHLRLDKEVRGIEEGLRQGRYGDRFVLKSIWASRHQDLRQTLLDFKPTIVHFCGHSSPTDIALEGDDGRTQRVSGKALAELFRLFNDKVDCVVLNSCKSAAQAEKLAEHIGVVVGMPHSVVDELGVAFAASFYEALASGENYSFAFNFASAATQMVQFSDRDRPSLLQREALHGENPASISPVRRQSTESGSDKPPGKIEAPPLIHPSVSATPAPGEGRRKTAGIATTIGMLVVMAGGLASWQCFGPTDPWSVHVSGVNSEPLVGAEVVFFADGGPFQAHTDSLGAAALPAAARSERGRLVVKMDAYATYEQQIEKPPSGPTQVRLRERRPEDDKVTFRLVDTAGEPVSNASIQLFLGADNLSQMTGNDGLVKLPVGFVDGKADVRLSVQHSSCSSSYQQLTLLANSLQDIALDCASKTLKVRPRATAAEASEG